MDRQKFIYYAQSLRFIDTSPTVNNETFYYHLEKTLSPQQKQAIHFMLLQDQILQKLISVNKIDVPQAESVLSRSFRSIKSNKVQSFFSHAGITLNDLQTTIQQSEQHYNDDEKKVAQLILHMESLHKNQDFGHYQVVTKLGSGGMATVYKAYDSKLQRYVAIKKMHGDNDKVKKRFLQEAQITAKLKHQNIIAVHEICSEKNYIVMDFIDGQPLSEYLKGKKLSIRHGLEILRDVANAIHYAHGQKIIHRDLKPDNIMIEKESRRAIVMDFGIAKNIDAKNDLTKTGEIIGTPRYMAPEQLQGKRKVNKQTDVYALGAILYEVLTGKQLVLGKNTMNLMYEILNVAPIPPRTRNPRLSIDLETICLKAVEKSPHKRYLTAAKFAADIDSFLKGEVISAKRRSRLYVQWQNIKKRKSFAITVCALLLLIGYLVHRSFFAAAYIKIILHNTQQQTIHDTSVMVNGTPMETNTFVKVNAGLKKFVFTSPSYQEKSIHKQIYPGEKDTITETLVAKKGFISLDSVLENIHVSLLKDTQTQPMELVAPIRNHALDIGKYTITFSKQNYFSYTITTEIVHDKVLHHNIHLIPMLMWSNTIFQQPKAIAIASSDIDKDGFAELIYGDKNGDLYCFSLKEQKQLWKISSHLPEIHNAGQIKIIDVNRDGIDDIVWAHYTEFSIIDGKTHQHLFHQLNWWGFEFIFANANDDVYPDLIMFPRYQGATCHDIFNKKILWQNSFMARQLCSPRIHSPDKITVAQGNYMKQHVSGLFTINVKNGFLNSLSSLSGVATMDYDPKENLYALFDPFKGLSVQKTTQHLIHKRESDTSYLDFPQFFDIDNDSDKEIVLYSDKLYAFDPKKRCIKYTLWDPKGTAFTRNELKKYILDIDKDGVVEIVCAFDHMVTISNYKSPQKSVVLKLPERVLGCVFIDTNNDDILDIVCLSAKTLYCFSCFLQKTHVVDENTRFNRFCVAPASKQVIVTSTAGNIQAFDSQNWQKLWRYTTKANSVSIAVENILHSDPDEEVIVHHDKAITLLKNGKKVWESIVSDAPASANNAMAIHDLDRDGTKEIYSGLFFGGIVCLKATTGEQLWSKKVGKIHTKPCFVDINDDGQTECFVLSRQGLYSIDSTGKTKWQVFVGPESEGSEMQIHQGSVIIGQKQGIVSCVDGITGRIKWQKKIPCSMISAGYLLDIDHNGDIEYVCTTIRGKLIALNPQNGTTKWIRHHPHYRYAFVNGKQLYVTGSTFTIAKINAQGYSYDHVLHQGIIDHNKLCITDIDGNGQRDLVYINEERKLICAYNWLEKTRKHSILCYDTDTRNFLRDLQLNRSFPHLLQKNIVTNGTLSASLFKVNRLIKQSNWLAAQQQLAKLHQQYPHSMEVQFLQLLSELHMDNRRSAQRRIHLCVEKSIVEFEELWQKYFHAFDKHQQLQRHVFKAITNTKTYSKLENIYWGSVYSHRNADKILSILAKYDRTPKKKYRRKYKDMLFAQIEKNKAVYTQYSHIEILDNGIQQLIVDDELQYMKSLYQFVYGYDTTALKTAIASKMPVEKQALRYALLALSFAQNPTYLQKFSRLNLQKDSLLYKIYRCIAYKHKKDIENTFQQHMPQINQNPFYSYIFQILRQRRSQ